ncbi:MAG TPA: hypothetical protein ENG28_02630 [Deltaproteobacteria bacterium]|nr:hypothetical protein [Deltaproteobacteria bacterium]
MISFDLTKEQKALKDRLHRIAVDKIQPYSLEIDASKPGKIDKRYLEIIAQEKLNAFIIPERYGGRPLKWVTLSLVVEELGLGCAGFAGIYAQTLHAVSTILIGGSPAQKKEFLPLLLGPSGAVASFCLTEEKGGSDVSSFSTTALLEKHAYYRLNGSKTPIINAGDAAFYVVWANTGTGKKGLAEINAFIIPRYEQGMSFGPFHDKPGLRSAPTATVFLKDLKVPISNLIGPSGSGYLLFTQTIDRGRALVGSICVGLARAAIEMAIGFAKERTVRARPIIRNQDISFSLAELATDLEAARLLVWKACHRMDKHMDYTALSSMAKLFASELAVRATTQGMLILGQRGCKRPSLMDKFQRDAQMTRIIEGTSQVQKMIIASQL